MQRAWPYLLPYAVLLVCAELARWLPAAAAPPLLALRVLLPAVLLAVAARRGAFPELATGPGPAGVSLDVGFGAAIAALWMAPYLLWPALPRGQAFDPDALGASLRPAWVGLRLLGFVAVSPLVEELFVRSFLHRAAEAWPDWSGFWRRPLARPQRFAVANGTIGALVAFGPWSLWSFL
jgi:hypothetical protein